MRSLALVLSLLIQDKNYKPFKMLSRVKNAAASIVIVNIAYTIIFFFRKKNAHYVVGRVDKSCPLRRATVRIGCPLIFS